MSLCCTVLQFEFNDIISMYMKNDSVRKRFVSLGHFILYLYYYYTYYIVIHNYKITKK